MSVIVHTTDLSGDDQAAFAHAVALASARGAKLCSVHACAGPAPERPFPDATRLLESWRSEREPIVHEAMMHQCCEDVTDTLLDALRRVEPELVVTATHGRSGLARVFAESVAESVARNVKVPTLIVPLSGDGFVDGATGAVRLGRVLVPVGSAQEAQRGVRAAAWLLELAGVSDAEIVLLHVDDGTPMPAVELPPGVKARARFAKGSLEQAVAEAAQSERACAVVMVTHGHDSVSDVLFGSHTERVLASAGCPVLSVPLV